MTLRIEENELLAALLTARVMGTVPIKMDKSRDAREFRDTYLFFLREFIELNKAELQENLK